MRNNKTNNIIYYLFALLVFTAISTSSGNAQDPQPYSKCPDIAVVCPTDCPKADEDIIFRANIEVGGSKISPKVNWSISNGKIITGQGTDALTVRFDNHCEPVTVTVEVDGLPTGCNGSSSCTTGTDCCWAPQARWFDKFGDINCEDEMARLDNLVIQLESEPGAQAYIVFYGGRSYQGRMARRGESEARAGRVEKYLLNNRGIEAGRIIMVNGGYRESWAAELWIAPLGAEAPTPTPTVGSKDMKFSRSKIKKGEYNCGI